MAARATPRRLDASGARWALITAALLLVFVERFVPHGRVALYPFALFATWVHEMGHGLTALLVGGRFDALHIFGDASGVAQIRVPDGAPEALASAGGLIAPPLVGALSLAIGRGPRRARAVLGGLSLAMLASLVVWVRSPVGIVSVSCVALLLAAVARWGGPRVAVVGAQLLGLLLGLDAVQRADYLFAASARVGGRVQRSDVSAIADAVGGSYVLWGALITALGALMLGAGLWAAWRSPGRGAHLTARGERP